MKKTKVSLVSYLNTLPFLKGLEEDTLLQNQMELSKDIPSICAKKLIEGEVDLGLIPVAVIPKIESPVLLNNYCIGATGEVHTVLLLSEVPLEEIESIYLDYQSRTSVKLCQLLCRDYWKIQVKFIDARPGFEEKISGNTAGLIIGDRTFNLPERLKYRYDLSEAWYKWTNLPFVFAAWVANKNLDQQFINQFSKALEQGLEAKDQIIAKFENEFISKDVLESYLNNSIEYHLDEKKKQGMNLFLEKIKTLDLIEHE